MKKTIIALLALCGMASAASTVLTFQTDDLTYATDKWALNGVGNGPGGSWSGSTTLNDGTAATLYMNHGKFWDRATVQAWTNEAALAAMNADLGTTLTADDLTSIKIDASGSNGSTSNLTLNFSGNTSFQAGQDIVFYLLVATTNVDNSAAYNNFSVTGLADSSVSWAAANGDGFNTSTINTPCANLAMIKVEGTLTNEGVKFASTSAKNGWAMVAYTTPSVPHPASATLSLLALAGLASRRRRK